jgi:hypothetical protein
MLVMATQWPKNICEVMYEFILYLGFITWAKEGRL